MTTCSEGRLVNASKRRRRYDNCVAVCVRDLLYADDTGFVSHSQVDLQTILDRFTAASASFGLSISVRKTEVLHQPTTGTPYTAPTSCSVVNHSMSLPHLNTLGVPSQTTAASTTNCRLEFSRPLPHSDDYASHYGTNTASSNKMQGLPCCHPVISSVQFRDIHTV